MPHARFVRMALVALRTAAGLALGGLITAVLVEAFIYHPTGAYVHRTLGPTNRPGLDVHGMEGFAWSRIGDDGVRVPLSGAEPLAEQRLLCLGDSYTEAFQLPYGRTYPAQLEGLLEDALGEDVTCLNAGASGNSPADYLATAMYWTQTYDPDVVVIQLTSNDFGKDLFNESFPYSLAADGEGFVVRTGPWAAALDADPILGEPEALCTFGDGVRWVYEDIAAKRAAAARTAAPGEQITSDAEPEMLAADGVPADPDSRGEASVIRWVVDALARAYDCPVVLVYIPALQYPDVSRQPASNERNLSAAADENGLITLSMREAYVDRFLADGSPSRGFANTTPGLGHINALGHRLLAEALASTILEEALVR